MAAAGKETHTFKSRRFGYRSNSATSGFGDGTNIPTAMIAPMSTERATGIESTGTTDEALCKRLDALETLVEDQQAQIEELEDTVEDQSEEIEQLREEIERAEDSRGYIIEDIVDVEQQLEDVETGSPDAKGGDSTGGSGAQRPEMKPIERLSRIDDMDDTAIDVTPTIERAVAIHDHWAEWSDKTPKGRVLKDNLKTLLRTATGDNLNWKQSYRAAEALEELSKGEIQFTKHRRHGKMLIQPSAANGDCHSSKAATS